ncbi:MAG: TatD family hydrolase [Patescibacteria group bacterium]|jgi:TatD DNase family protein
MAPAQLKLIDAHCHVNFNAYQDDAEAVIRRSLEQGIGLITVGTQRDTSAAAVDLAEKYDGVWSIIGLHPIHLFEREADEEETSAQGSEEIFDAARYRELIGRSSKVVGLGECGLDYFHRPKNVAEAEFKARQARVFRSHLDLSLETGLPVMIHCRDAHDDVIAILEEYRTAGRPVRGDIHCFTGSWKDAARYLDLGFYISFTGIVTYPPRAADKAKGEVLADIARQVPLDRLIVETDAPYLAPVPHRGERNEPANVRFVAAEIARIRQLPVEEVAARTLKNTVGLFGLKV